MATSAFIGNLLPPGWRNYQCSLACAVASRKSQNLSLHISEILLTDLPPISVDEDGERRGERIRLLSLVTGPRRQPRRSPEPLRTRHRN
jgi:hypothetical protein